MKATSISDTAIRERALLGARWFLHTQTVSRPPVHDANHGRVLYNLHLPSGSAVRGLSWSQGRAIMCLLGAWELSGGEREYLEAAVRCGDYLRYGLQTLDARHPRSFGALREETPCSRFCYPRDAIEGAFGLLLLHVATGDPDYLERCEIFAEWYLTQAIDRTVGWPHGTVDFDDPRRDPFPLRFFQAGGAPFFWHLFGITGNRRYLTRGLRLMADGLLSRFFDAGSGAILSSAEDVHHALSGARGSVAVNDDGASVALTCAHAAFGPRAAGCHLKAALRYGDWLLDACPRPLALWAAPGLHAMTLLELSAVSGQARYAEFARKLMAAHVRNQVLAPGKPDRHGAFRGEDEPAHWYVKGAKATDFVTTRATAYGTLALLRLAGILGPGYSSQGFERLARFSAKMRKAAASPNCQPRSHRTRRRV